MKTANEILLEKREARLLEELDPKEEAARLSRAIAEFLKGGPPLDDIAKSSLQASQAMKFYNLALTLSAKLKDDRLASLAKRDLPKYWEGKIPYSKNQKFTPAQRRGI